MIATAIQIFVLVTIARHLRTDTTGFDTKSPNFALYTSYGFRECVSAEAPRVNCTMIYDGLADLHLHVLKTGTARQGTMARNYWWDPLVNSTDLNKKYLYTWCDMACFFKEFKVIPSSLRPSAFKLGTVVVCCFYNITALSAQWSLRHLIFGKSHSAATCQGVSIADWVFYAFDFTCFVMWWVVFSLLALNPAYHMGVSLLACWTAYRYLFAIYRTQSLAGSPETLRDESS
jgi:hypothetical protein